MCSTIYEAISGRYANIGIFAFITMAIQQASANFQQAFSTCFRNG